jgi:hypothetical protein
MNDSNPPSSPAESPRPARNKGKLTGPKPPLRPGHVWSIRAKLQLERRVRDLALFNLAIDSKLRGCDLVALRVDEVAPNGYAIDRATVRQGKTGRPVRFELTDVTRLSLAKIAGDMPVIAMRSRAVLGGRISWPDPERRRKPCRAGPEPPRRTVWTIRYPQSPSRNKSCTMPPNLEHRRWQRS